MTNSTKGQWPDNICSGDIRYGKASNYDGFYLADASHGIPTFGSVADSDPVTISGQHVKVFNYPGQTEAIAAQIVHRWNAHEAMLAVLRDFLAGIGNISGANNREAQFLESIEDAARIAVAKAEGKAHV